MWRNRSNDPPIELTTRNRLCPKAAGRRIKRGVLLPSNALQITSVTRTKVTVRVPGSRDDVVIPRRLITKAKFTILAR